MPTESPQGREDWLQQLEEAFEREFVRERRDEQYADEARDDLEEHSK